MPEKELALEKLSRRLTAQDASFIYGETQNGPLHIGSLAFFEDEITLGELIGHLESKLDLIPRYRQRLVPVPFNLNHATLEDDPDFKLENHLKLHQLPAGADEAELIEAAMAVFCKPLNRSRPLWEMHLFNGFDGDRSVLMWSIHHCLIDGVSGMELLTVMMDFRPDPPPAEPPASRWSPKPLPNPIRLVIDASLDLAQSQIDSLRRANQAPFGLGSLVGGSGSTVSTVRKLMEQMTRPIAATPWSAGLVSQERTLAWLRTGFADVRAIRSAFGGTINDVVLTMLTEGAARYLRHHNITPGAPFRLGCPVNVRRPNESGALGNRVSMMFPEVPAEPMDPVARLKLVTADTLRIKEAAEPQALEGLTSNGEVVPPALMGMLSGVMTATMDAAVFLAKLVPLLTRMLAPRAAGISFVATNVPGAQVPLYLAGHRLVDYIGLLPLGGNLGFGVPIVSYNQNLYFTMMAEPNLMPDPDLMKSLVEEVFEELKLAAAVTQSATVVVQAPQRRKTRPRPAPAAVAARPREEAGNGKASRPD